MMLTTMDPAESATTLPITPAAPPSRAGAPAQRAGAFATSLASLQEVATTERVSAGAPNASEVFEAETVDPRAQRLDQQQQQARLNDLSGGAEQNKFTRSPSGAANADAGSKRADHKQVQVLSPSAEPGQRNLTDASASSKGGDADRAPVPSGASPPIQEAHHGGSATAGGDPVQGNDESSMGATLRPLDATASSTPATSIAATGAAAPLAQQIANWLVEAGGASASSAPVRGVEPVISAGADAQRSNEPSASRAQVARESTDGSSSRQIRQTPATFERLIRSIHMRQDGASSRATLDLQPESLGRLRIEATMTGGELALRIETQTEEAGRILSERLAELKQALHEQGIRTGAIEWIAWDSDSTAGANADRAPPDDRRSPFSPGFGQFAGSSGSPEDRATTRNATHTGHEPVSYAGADGTEGGWDIRA